MKEKKKKKERKGYTLNGAQEATAIRVFHEKFKLCGIQDIGVGVYIVDCSFHGRLSSSSDDGIKSKNGSDVKNRRNLAVDRRSEVKEPYESMKHKEQRQRNKMNH